MIHETMRSRVRGAVRALRALVAVPLLAGIGNCSDDPQTSGGCVEGTSQACACSDGRSGAQVCQAGRYGDCTCTAGPDSGTPDGGGGGAGADAEPPDADLRTPCQRMCDHVYLDCGSNFTTAGGAAVSRSECITRCNGGQFSNDEITCFTGAQCAKQALDACFGQGGPVCPRDRDCTGRACGLDPVCKESCGTCSGSLTCNASGRCVSASGWQVEPVAANVSTSPSLAIDSQGTLHAAWTTWGGDLLYANSGSGWTTTVVERSGNELVSQQVVLQLRADGSPCIAYYAPVDQHLHYACLDGTTWKVEIADSDKSVGKYSSLAIDGQGRAHISYHDEETSALKYALRATNGTWSTEVIETGLFAGYFTSIAVDAAGSPRIAYARGYSRVRYAFPDGASGWTTEDVSSDTEIAFVRLALDAAGLPHVTYQDRGGLKLRYATRDALGSWMLEEIDSVGSGNGHSRIRVNAGTPAVCYFETVFSDLKYARRSGGAWQKELVDDGSNAGMECDLAFTAAGVPHILYLTNRIGENVSHAFKP
jgi:hypothetical protein